MNTCHAMFDRAPCGTRAKRQSGSRLLCILKSIPRWLERQHERRQLAEMPDYLLKDLGISWDQAYQESRKHFWQD